MSGFVLFCHTWCWAFWHVGLCPVLPYWVLSCWALSCSAIPASVLFIHTELSPVLPYWAFSCSALTASVLFSHIGLSPVLPYWVLSYSAILDFILFSHTEIVRKSCTVNILVCAGACLCVCVYVHVRACVHACACMHASACTCACMYALRIVSPGKIIMALYKYFNYYYNYPGLCAALPHHFFLFCFALVSFVLLWLCEIWTHFSAIVTCTHSTA